MSDIKANVADRSPQLGLPPAVAGLLQSLPSPELGWTQEKRDKFLAVLGVTLDFYIPVVEQEVSNNQLGVEADNDET